MYFQIFTAESKLLKALAHPKRLEIVQLLHDQELNVSEILKMLSLPQANVSQHLMILREAGLLTAQKSGKQIIYKIADPRFLKAVDAIREVLIDRYKNSPLADEITLSMNELTPVVHDPVCKMRLSPKTASFVSKFQAKTYYFCASGCLQAFQKNPQKYEK